MYSAVVISDMHVGSAYAVFPPRFQLSTGALASLNTGQQYLLQCWRDFEQRIPDRFEVLILNGDILNGQNKKEAAADLTEVDPAWQQRAALELLGPVAARAEKVWLTQGSTYHSGEVARWEEQLGYQLCAQADPMGHYAWDWLLLDIEGVRLDVAHHQSVVMRYVTMPLEREQQFDRIIAEWKGGSAHLIVRSHAHRYVEAHVELQQSVATASWQLQSRYVRRGRLPNRMFSQYLGGLWVELHPENVGQPEYCATLHPVLYRHPRLAGAKYVEA